MEYPLAFPNIDGDAFQLNEKIVMEGIAASRNSPRKRIILPIHRTQDAEVQRMINFMQPGTYIRPHIHPMDGASESLVLIKGQIDMVLFEEHGKIRSQHTVKAGSINCVFDIEPNIWHSFVVTQANTILFECKKGPYSSISDKHFAEWAPEEGSKEADIWLQSLYLKLGFE